MALTQHRKSDLVMLKPLFYSDYFCKTLVSDPALQEPNPYYPLERVLDVFRRNNVAGILANSRPNKGTHQLVDAKALGLWVVPFIRPYRTRDDIQNWSSNPAIYDLIEAEYKRGYFRGVCEFHIYGYAAQR